MPGTAPPCRTGCLLPPVPPSNPKAPPLLMTHRAETSAATMTTIRQLLDRWNDGGIRLWEDDGQLRYRAPRGVVTAETLAELKRNKDAILEELRVASGPRPDPEHRHDPFPLTDVQGAYLMGRSSVFE